MPKVYRNDEFEMEDLAEFDIIVLSPGPGLPKDAGKLIQILELYSEHKIILGVCLGQQAIGTFYGGELVNLPKVYHGVASPISHLNDPILYRTLGSSLKIGRYHSWVVDKNTFPESLEITSIDEDGNVMSLKHRTLPIHGVQFHPESVLTPSGMKILQNFFTFYTK